MARKRADLLLAPISPDPRVHWLNQDDFHRFSFCLPDDVQRAMMRRAAPEMDDAAIDAAIAFIRKTRHLDPLAPLSNDMLESGLERGQMIGLNISPNFEVSLFLAQATGSIIVTDSPARWRELRKAARPNHGAAPNVLPHVVAAIEQEEHLYLGDASRILSLHRKTELGAYRSLLHDMLKYVTAAGSARKPDWEAQLPNRLARANANLRKAVRADSNVVAGRVKCIIPTGGIRDSSVDRLLLMSSIDHHFDGVPMAFFIERPDPSGYSRAFPSKPWAHWPNQSSRK